MTTDNRSVLADTLAQLDGPRYPEGTVIGPDGTPWFPGHMLAIGEAHPYRGTQSRHACDNVPGTECQHVTAGPYQRQRVASGGILPRGTRRMAALMAQRPLGLPRTPTATPLAWSEAMHAGDVKTWREGHMAYRLSGPEGGDRDAQAIREQFPALHALMRGQSVKGDTSRATAARQAKRAQAQAMREALAGTGPVAVPAPRAYVRQGDARLVAVASE
jgi:hypothetical protein